MKMVRHFIMVVILIGLHTICYAQRNDTIPSFIKGKQATGARVTDTLPKGKNAAGHDRKGKMDSPYKVDTATRRKHDPRKATLYSTFFPGLGQIYNHKYWKLPLVYAAVGIPAYTYFYNRSWYQKCQYAIAVIVNGTTNQDSLNKVDPKLSAFITSKDDNSLRSYRNQFRRDQDYSVIFFLLFWGLQIVDATVDAHLMHFDISNDLTIHLKEASGSYGQAGNSSWSTPLGLGLAFDIHKPRHKLIPLH